MAHHFTRLDKSIQEELEKVARELVTRGKGILAIDEFNDQAGGLLAAVGQENTPENRRKFREMLFTTPNLEKYVSGVILYDETVWQKTSSGIPFPQYLLSRGIYPGVKADCNIVPLMGTDGEVTTQGLDDLTERCKKYKAAGIKFAKWRCVMQIADKKPSALSVNESAHVNARYVTCCQQVGIVPIVEPDISNAGDHSLEVSQKTTEKVFSAFYKSMHDHHCHLEGTLLKPAFCTPGTTGGPSATVTQVADATLTAFRRTVPAAVPGCAFLSGGLGDEKSTEYLNAVNVNKGSPAPWKLTFSYGRALTGSAWKVYGKNCNVKAAQEEFEKRLIVNSLAAKGEVSYK